MDSKIIFIGHENSGFAKNVGKKAGIPVIASENITFSKGEVKNRPLETVRGCHIFIIFQTFDNKKEDINAQLFRVFVLADALVRASAERITLVSPFLPYTRQDYKAKHRDPVTIKVLMNFLKLSEIYNLVTFDLHAKQTEGHFTRVDHIGFKTILANHLQSTLDTTDLVIASGDVGGAERVKHLARKVGCSFVIVDKTRLKDAEVDKMILVGEVKGKHIVLADDMTDTGGTLMKAAELLIEKGALSVIAAITHLFNDTALIRRLNECTFIEKILHTDSIFNHRLPKKFELISLVDETASVITNIINGKSHDFS